MRFKGTIKQLKVYLANMCKVYGNITIKELNNLPILIEYIKRVV